MAAFPESMREYRKQLEKGAIQKAYRGLMEYVMGLRTYLSTRYPDHIVSAGIYYGYMDMTYFAFFPRSLKDRNLKVAIVFVHEAFRFEAWLAGSNRQVQAEYWKRFKESGWKKYPLVPSIRGRDAIIEHVLVDAPDFSDLDVLTRQIEGRTVEFIRDVGSCLETLPQ